MDEEDSNCIMDRYFYECYKKLADKTAKYLWYYGIRTLILILSIPVNHFIFEDGKDEKLSLFSIFLIVTLTVSLLQLALASVLYFNKVTNKSRIFKIATELHHTKQADSLKNIQRDDQQQLAELYEIQERLNFKVSVAYYDFQNMEKTNDVSIEYKYLREDTGQRVIRIALQTDMKLYRVVENLLKLGSAAILVFGFVVGSISTINEAQHSLLQIVLISQVVLKPKIFTILIIICLVPVIIVFLIVYVCCCRKGQKRANLPGKIKVTTETIAKCAECSICFQDYVKQEDIIVLPCAQSHIFHQTCIEGWTKVKPNCPICRKQLCE